MIVLQLWGFPSRQAGGLIRLKEKDGRSSELILTYDQSQTTSLWSQQILSNISSLNSSFLFSSPLHIHYMCFMLFSIWWCKSDSVALFVRLLKTFSEVVKLSDRFFPSIALNNFHVRFISHLLPPSSVSFPLNAPCSIQKARPRLTCIYNVFVSGSPLRRGALLWRVGTVDNVGVVRRSWLAVHSQMSQSGATAEVLSVQLL